MPHNIVPQLSGVNSTSSLRKRGD